MLQSYCIEWRSLGPGNLTYFVSAVMSEFTDVAYIGGIRDSANNAVRIHAGGIAALLQKRSPPDIGDEIDVQISLDCHLSIVRNQRSWIVSQNLSIHEPWHRISKSCTTGS